MVELTLLVLRCQDLESSRALYAALGLELVREQHGDGPAHYSAQLGSTVIELYPGSADPSTRIGLRVKNVDSIVRRAVELGAQLVRPVTRCAAGKGAILADLDGRRLELTEPGDLNGATTHGS